MTRTHFHVIATEVLVTMVRTSISGFDTHLSNAKTSAVEIPWENSVVGGLQGIGRIRIFLERRRGGSLGQECHAGKQ